MAPNPELTFVSHDIEILARHFEVDTVFRRDHDSRSKLLATVVRKLRAGRYVLLFMWFAEPYDSPYILLLARLFRLHCVLVTGGYDVAAIPEIGYGALSRRRDRWAVKLAIWLSHAVLPFSEFSAAEVRRLARPGVLRVVYPGVDVERFRPHGGPKERLVITVGTVSEGVWRRKGLDTFARCAPLLPNVKFVIVGRCLDSEVAEKLRQIGGANLALTGRRVSPEELLGWYQRAQVYAQLSLHEGFGLAVAEAMACECVPVGANIGSLPEVIGDAGALVARADLEESAHAIRWALDEASGRRARARISRLYPLSRRARELQEILVKFE